ncbi:hypothetical protein DSM05_02650 [Pseudomonas sp. FW305-3-2-15-E-TSA4]|nr:hypothetical protein [Pseudomonas sp. FW305-3-2-15-E-TSA4]
MLAALAVVLLTYQSAGLIETCEQNLLSYADWVGTPDTQWTTEITGAAGHLTFVGVKHSRDPDDSQFVMIKETFARARPTLVFYVGPDRGIGTDGPGTIRTRGESGFVRWLASDADLPTRSLEPPPIDLFIGLTENYPPDQVELFFVLREAARLRDREGLQGPALDDAVSSLLSRLQSAVGAMALPFATIEELDAAYATYWADGTDWRSAPGSWFDPTADDEQTGGRFMATLNAASSERRNVFMYRALATATRSGERVYAAVGRNHVPMLREVLRCAITAGSSEGPFRSLADPCVAFDRTSSSCCAANIPQLALNAAGNHGGAPPDDRA